MDRTVIGEVLKFDTGIFDIRLKLVKWNGSCGYPIKVSNTSQECEQGETASAELEGGRVGNASQTAPLQ